MNHFLFFPRCPRFYSHPKSGVCLIRYAVLVSVFFLLCVSPTRSSDLPSYSGKLFLPVSLFTAQGTKLEAGPYDLELKPKDDHYVLVFSSGGQAKATLDPWSGTGLDLSTTHSPLVGVHYLRSSEEPNLTGEERRVSKTGAAQYEEENRDWKATLRTYKSSATGEVYFLFQVRKAQGRWSRTIYQLTLEKK
ncbi:MAG: hypothetical protein U0V70_22215 [Terriglobia bacterium]